MFEEPLRLVVLVEVTSMCVRKTIGVDLRIFPFSVQGFDLLSPGDTLSDQFHGVVRVGRDAIDKR